MSLRRRVCAPPVPKLPSGLLELMDGLARDVLKNNPENIYEFCAQHMQTLLEIRDGRGPKTFLTLDQKIAKAQKKYRERAEQRRRNYDKELLSATNVSNKSDIVSPLNTANDLSIGPVDNLKIHDITESKNVKISIDKEENQIKIDNLKIHDITESKNVKISIDQEENQIKIPDNSNQKGLLKATDDKIKDEEERMSYQETSKFNSISEENESVNLAIDNSIGCKDANDGLEQTEEKITLSLKQEAMEFEITDYVSKNTSNRRLQTDENPIITQSEINDETVSSRDVGSQLQNEDIEKNTENSIEIDRKINYTTINGMIDEIFSPEKHLTDISAPSVTTATLDCNSHSLEGVVPVNANKNEYEPENIALLENESNKKTNAEISTSENNNVIKKQTDFIDNLDQEDDKILAVILNKKGDSDIRVQDKELVVSNNEPNQSPKNVADPENVPEPTNDKTSNNLMDLETAAITIQKVFRSFLFKTKSLSYDDTTVDINLPNGDKEKEENEALTIQLKDRRPLGISRMDTVLQTVNEEKSLSLSTDDSSTLSSAATIIQAHVRGFLVRNKYNLNKTTSTNSLIDSDLSIPSLEADSENRKSKTILNIHIVPEGGHFVSRDESILTSIDLSLDSSPPSSVNLHPLGYDKSERRKQLKREDAIQSVSPPSNNSGKLSDEHDSVKEILTGTEKQESVFDENVINTTDDVLNNVDNALTDVTSDDMDVITPLLPVEEKSSHDNDNSSKLLHSGEFHDAVVPTNVTRSDTSVVREFQNVLVYFIMWNN